MTPFSSKSGSKKSIQFLKALNEKTSELNSLFMSDAIRMLLLNKFKKVKKHGYLRVCAYAAYLICLFTIPNKFLMLFWFIFHASIKFYILTH
jgi:hypothetical protein